MLARFLILLLLFNASLSWAGFMTAAMPMQTTSNFSIDNLKKINPIDAYCAENQNNCKDTSHDCTSMLHHCVSNVLAMWGNTQQPHANVLSTYNISTLHAFHSQFLIPDVPPPLA